MYECCRCNVNKLSNEFNMREIKQYLQKQIEFIACKKCKAKRWREKHHNRVLAYKVKHGNKLRIKNVDLLVAYLKEHPCVDCGSTDLLVLEFDHVRGSKSFTISTKIRRFSWDIIEKEIEKCDVRCSNCHRRKTARQFNYSRLKYV